MKNNDNNITSKLLKSFDKELEMILRNDLKAFHATKGKFLSNNSDNKQKTLLVA